MPTRLRSGSCSPVNSAPFRATTAQYDGSTGSLPYSYVAKLESVWRRRLSLRQLRRISAQLAAFRFDTRIPPR